MLSLHKLIVSTTHFLQNVTLTTQSSQNNQNFFTMNISDTACVFLYSEHAVLLRSKVDIDPNLISVLKKTDNLNINSNQVLVLRYVPNINNILVFADVYSNNSLQNVWMSLNVNLDNKEAMLNEFTNLNPNKVQIQKTIHKVMLRQNEVDYPLLVYKLDQHDLFHLNTDETSIRQYSFYDDTRLEIKGYVSVQMIPQQILILITRIDIPFDNFIISNINEEIFQELVKIIRHIKVKKPDGAHLLLQQDIRTRDINERLKRFDPELFTFGFSKTNCQPVPLTQHDLQQQQVINHIAQYEKISYRDNVYACRKGNFPFVGLRKYTDLYRVLDTKTDTYSEFLPEREAQTRKTKDQIIIGPDPERSKWSWPCCFAVSQAHKQTRMIPTSSSVYELKLIKKLEPDRVGTIPTSLKNVFDKSYKRLGVVGNTIMSCINKALNLKLSIVDVDTSQKFLNHGKLFSFEDKSSPWSLAHALSLKLNMNIIMFSSENIVLPFVLIPDKDIIFIFNYSPPHGDCDLITYKTATVHKFDKHRDLLKNIQKQIIKHNQMDQWLISEVKIDPRQVTKIVVDEHNRVWYVYINDLYIPSLIDIPWPSHSSYGNIEIIDFKNMPLQPLEFVLDKIKNTGLSINYGIANTANVIIGLQFSNGMHMPILETTTTTLPIQKRYLITPALTTEEPKFKKIIQERIFLTQKLLNRARLIISQSTTSSDILKIVNDKKTTYTVKQKQLVNIISEILKDFNFDVIHVPYLSYQIVSEILWLGEKSEILQKKVIEKIDINDGSMIMFV